MCAAAMETVWRGICYRGQRARPVVRRLWARVILAEMEFEERPIGEAEPAQRAGRDK